MGGKKESLLTFDELLNAVKGKDVGLAGYKEKFYFTSVVTDSRDVVQGSLFVPLLGDAQDGHKYIPEALKKGATVVFVTASIYRENSKKYMEIISENPNTTFIVVQNNLFALQDAAAFYVSKFPNLIKVAITGSSGKTTTKEIATAILQKKFNVISTQGNLNSETGLPLSVFKIRKEHTLGLFEMGMNRENEIGEIARVLKPEYALITNIGTAHIGILGSRENIAREKRKIFFYIPKTGAAIVPAEDDFKDFLTENVVGRVIEFGINVPTEKSGVRFIKDCGIEGTKFSIDGYDARLLLPGKYNYINALSCIALAKVLGVESEKIVEAINNFRMPLGGRSEIMKVVAKKKNNTSVNITILSDFYNANPDSMKKSLELSSSLQISGKKIYVLGDMKELGKKSLEEHAQLATEATCSNANIVIFVGEEITKGAKVASLSGLCAVQFFEDDSDETICKVCDFILENLNEGDFVLLKASHSMGFERIFFGITEDKNFKEVKK